jgi:hypothetical protein
MQKILKVQIQSKEKSTVKPVYNGHSLDPKKVAVVHRWLFCRGFSIKIGTKISLAGLSLAIVDRWPLFRGGC